MSSESFSQKAIKTSNLVNRAETNSKFGSKDFASWTANLLSNLEFRSVLDVCCGTGNQLVLYAGNPEAHQIVGVDVSPKSLDLAEQRLQLFANSKNIVLVPESMERMFLDPRLMGKKFDLISCFYGLYYSADVSKTLTEMLDHLTDSGTLLVVGPCGDNNKSLFDALRLFFPLPPLVARSSSTFMAGEVLPFLADSCHVRTEMMVNTIRYPDVDSVMSYWKSSTFFSPEHERAVLAEVERQFLNKSEFVVEKHIMAIVARKK